MNGKWKENERKMNGNEMKMKGKGKERKRKWKENKWKWMENEWKMKGKWKENERKMNGKGMENEWKWKENERKRNGKERKINGKWMDMKGKWMEMKGKWMEIKGKWREMNSKSTSSFEFSYDTTSKSTFRARLPSIFITCHKCHACDGICTLSALCAALTRRCAENTQHEAARWCKSIAPATQNRRGRAEKTRVGAISHSRDKAISVLGRKSRRPQKTPPRAFPLGRELTSWRRRRRDDTTTTPRRHHDDTTAARQTRREHRSNPQTPNYKREPFATLSGKRISDQHRHTHHSRHLPLRWLPALFSRSHKR